MRFKLGFVLKNSNNKNHNYFLMLFFLITLICFLLQDNAIVFFRTQLCVLWTYLCVFLRLESLKEYLVFYELSYVLKNKQDIVFFLACKTLRALLHYFPQIFSNHLFLMENIFLPCYIYLQRV